MFNNDYLNSLKKMEYEANSFYSKRDPISSSFNFDISSSTYRVFKNFKIAPSLIFKNWAFNLIKNNDFLFDILNIDSENKFNIFHEKYTKNLAIHWKEKTDSELHLAYNYKMFDLFLKSLINHDLNNNKINEILILYCNVPLDSVTFKTLDLITNSKFKLKNKTTGYIKNKETYYKIQFLIKNICDKVNLPKIYFEYYSQKQNKINNS